MSASSSDTVFTTALVQNGVVQWFDEHLARLKTHAEALCIPYPGNNAIRDAIQPAIDPSATHLVRITLGIGLLFATTRAINAPLPSDYAAARIIVTDVIVPEQFATIKTGYRLPYEQAQQVAIQQGAFEGLLIDDDGYVIDGV